jgi:hypothetical protein
MSYQDPPRHRHSSRYPTLAQYEDSHPPYQDSQRYQSYPDTSYQDTSHQDTRADHRRGNGHASGYRGFGGLTTGAPEQRPPWDNQWEQQPTEWQPAARQAPRRTSGPFFAASDDDYDDYTAPHDDDYGRERP